MNPILMLCRKIRPLVLNTVSFVPRSALCLFPYVVIFSSSLHCFAMRLMIPPSIFPSPTLSLQEQHLSTWQRLWSLPQVWLSCVMWCPWMTLTTASSLCHRRWASTQSVWNTKTCTSPAVPLSSPWAPLLVEALTKYTLLGLVWRGEKLTCQVCYHSECITKRWNMIVFVHYVLTGTSHW